MRDIGLFLDEGKEGETNPVVDVMECDLSSFKSTRAFAEKFKSKYDRLDVLMNNAGVMALPEKTLTEDANELQMQTNHFSHFALTRELLPLMLETEKRYPERKPRVQRERNVRQRRGVSLLGFRPERKSVFVVVVVILRSGGGQRFCPQSLLLLSSS